MSICMSQRAYTNIWDICKFLFLCTHIHGSCHSLSVLQCAAVCRSVLQCASVCCSVLQCVAVCCSVLQWATVSYVHIYMVCASRFLKLSLNHTATHCNTLQHNAAHCNTIKSPLSDRGNLCREQSWLHMLLHHTAWHCNTLQRTATQSSLSLQISTVFAARRAGSITDTIVFHVCSHAALTYTNTHTNKHAHTHTHAPHMHTRPFSLTHTRTRAHTQTRAFTHTHTHTIGTMVASSFINMKWHIHMCDLTHLYQGRDQTFSKMVTCRTFETNAAHLS